jgi:hypothetical protein
MVHTALGHWIPRRLPASATAKGRRQPAEVGDKTLRRLDAAVNAWTVKPVGSKATAPLGRPGRRGCRPAGPADHGGPPSRPLRHRQAADITGWLGTLQWAWSSGWAARGRCAREAALPFTACVLTMFPRRFPGRSGCR